MIKIVGWVPHKGIMHAMPLEEYAVQCAQAFLKYDFSESKVVGKVISYYTSMQRHGALAYECSSRRTEYLFVCLFVCFFCRFWEETAVTLSLCRCRCHALY